MNTILLSFSSRNENNMAELRKSIERVMTDWARLNNLTYVIVTEKDVDNIRDMARMILNLPDDKIFAVNIHGRNWSAFLPDRINNFLTEFI